METYDPKKIEKTWQEYWDTNHVFEAKDDSPNPKKYILDMFPYPSGDGLHVGHVKIYTGADVLSRYWRMKGFNVLHPTGWDAFGLPTENSAIKFGIHPADLTKRNVDRFRSQMKMMGFSYDWTREVATSDPEYYHWTQWIFLQLYKKGLAYQATIPINWCPSCLTGLANEEVVEGKCDRCGTQVELRPLRQWLLKITAYADRLLAGLDNLQWPPFILELQRNWIGKSEGLEEDWQVEGMDIKLKTFTTWPHTSWGTTFIVIAPEHPIIDTLVAGTEYEKGAHEFRDRVVQQKLQDPTNVEKNKEGYFLGRYAINHLTGRRIPLYSANFVIYTYGTGIVKCTGAHDQRDFEFARKYNLEIIPVIKPETGDVLDATTMKEAYTGEGTMMNAGQFDGMPTGEARQAIGEYTVGQGNGRWTVNYKLRDWVFSRQRYWGEPIPIIHCEVCGTVPVPEKDLPVTLPHVEQYKPTGTGESPLAAISDWVNVPCPHCGKPAKRETNTMPQWAGSSWYWIRFVDPHNAKAIASPAALKKWLPVDMYIGGAEHAVLHLLYARFWNMVLYDIGVVPQEEPFPQLKNVGLIMGEDGQKMSKSRGNVITPDSVVEDYGADTVRVYEMFMGPFELSNQWNSRSIHGIHRFLSRVWTYVQQHTQTTSESDETTAIAFHRALHKVTIATETMRYNTAIATLMELLNTLEAQKTVSKDIVEGFVLMLSPYAPHLAEALWHDLGYTTSVALQPWPQFDETIVRKANVTIPVQINGKVRGTLEVPVDESQETIEAHARKIPNVERYLQESVIRKTIFVPNRLLNFVVSKNP